MGIIAKIDRCTSRVRRTHIILLIVLMQDFFVWRDLRVMEECHWYGWFIGEFTRVSQSVC